MRDDFSELREQLRAALPEPEDKELAQVRAGLREKLAAERLRKRLSWPWMLAPATLLALVVSVVVRPHHAVREIQQPRPMQLAAAPLAGRDLVLPVRAQRPTPRVVFRRKAGMRDATVLVAADGSSRLRIRTTDPNVVILLPISENTNAEKN